MENSGALEELWGTPAFQFWTEGEGQKKETEQRWFRYKEEKQQNVESQKLRMCSKEDWVADSV